MSPLSFKTRVGSLIRTLPRHACYTSVRFTSGATPLPVYMASIAASRLPHMHSIANNVYFIIRCIMESGVCSFLPVATKLEFLGGGCLQIFFSFFFNFFSPKKIHSEMQKPTTPPPPRRSMRGRYASYWDSCFFFISGNTVRVESIRGPERRLSSIGESGFTGYRIA